MTLLIEPKNDLDVADRQITFSNELGSITDQLAQDPNVHPIEAAALQTTMSQINSEIELPAQESFMNRPNNFVVFASESLKDNIKGAWEKFINGVKTIFQKLKQFVTGGVEKLRRTIKRVFGKKETSKGSTEQKQESNDKTDSKETKAEEKPPEAKQEKAREVGEDVIVDPLTKKEAMSGDVVKPDGVHDVESCYVSMGKDSSLETVVERVKFYGKLLNFVIENVGRHSFERLVGEVLSKPENWERALDNLNQEILDSFMGDLDATVKFEVAAVTLSETCKVAFPLTEENTYLTVMLKTGEKVEIKGPTDKEDFRNLIRSDMGTVYELSGKLQNLLDVSSRELDQLQKVTTEILQKRIITMAPMLSKRVKFIGDVIKLIEHTCYFVVDLVED